MHRVHRISLRPGLARAFAALAAAALLLAGPATAPGWAASGSPTASASATASAPASASAATTAHSTDFRIGTSTALDSDNVFAQEQSISDDATQLGYDLLLNYSTGTGQPDFANSLATSYTVSKDALTWTFNLRPGVLWSDGTPFTSADVQWTYRAVLANQTNVLRGYLTNVGSVSAPGPLTVVLHLTSPDARISSIFIPILPKHVFSRYPVDKLDKITWPLPAVTTAPYQMTSYHENGTTVLTANPLFRGAQPAVRRVLFVYYGDQQSELQDIKLGNLDLIPDGNARWNTQLGGEKQIQAWGGAQPGYDVLGFNACPKGGAGACSGPGPDVHTDVVQNQAIRTALAYAVNRPDISKTVYAGANQPAYGLISPYYTLYYKDWSTDPQIGYRFSLAKAKQTLAAGGWNCATSPCTRDGVKAEFDLDVLTTDASGQNAVRRIVASAAEVGITIHMQVVTQDALNNLFYAKGATASTYAPDEDAYYEEWSGDATPDLNLEVLRTGDTWQDSFYSNPQYDKPSLAALQSTDFAQRVSLMHQAERIAMTDLPYIPVVYAYGDMLTRTDTWHGYQGSPGGSQGLPFAVNWLQITALQPGPAPDAVTTAASGSAGGDGGGGLPVPAGILLALLVGVVGYAFGVRRGRRFQVVDWTDE
jgi:peptide/nickel transport system substrate-binding protein